MELLNLTLAELLAFVVPLSAAVIALYFYDRSRRRRVVSTLTFWPRRPAYPMTTRRRRLQQPWSLLLQLLAAIFILLAIADLRFSGASQTPRHHVVILEASAWMSAPAAPGQTGTLLNLARNRASAFLDALPSGDPVLLIQGDANPMVVQGFTTNRTALRESLDSLQPNWTAANLADAIELAKSVLRLAATSSSASDDLTASDAVGEIVYIGGGRVSPEVLGRVDTSGLPFLRYIAVGEDVDDVGLTRVSAEREPADPKRWRVVAAVHNHSERPRSVRVEFEFERQPLGYKAVTIPPDRAQEVIFHLGTERAGALSAALAEEDGFAGNNRALLRLPPLRRRVVRFTTERESRWRPLLSAMPAVRAVFANAPNAPEPDLEVSDRTSLAATAGLLIQPPRDTSPIPIARTVGRTRIAQWLSNHPIADGLHTQDLTLARTHVFAPEPGDIVVAETAEGPVIVARETDGRKTVVYGFDPLESQLANRLVTPLLFANTLRWFSPDLFLSRQVSAGSPGLIETPVDAESEQDITVRSPETSNLPWSLTDGRLRFFMPTPGNVEVKTPFREAGWSLTLPELGTTRWEPPEGTLHGVPPPSAVAVGLGFPLWPWLTLLAVICWLVDWAYYGRVSPPRSASAASAGRHDAGAPSSLNITPPASPREYEPVGQSTEVR